MIGKTKVMLYAEDVEILSRFFIEKLGQPLVKRLIYLKHAKVQ